jgi:serine/threonine protein kinase
MRPVLHIKIEGEAVKVVDLMNVTLPCVLGRDAELSQISVPDNQVSRAHCVINQDGGLFTVEDLGSRNGTWLNEQKIAKNELKDGDKIRIGSTTVRVEMPKEQVADPLVGQKIGGFSLHAVLGKGRYGTVYRGVQVALARPVAVKILAEEYRKDPERVKAFLTEARHAGRLNHPNLVQVHDVCQVDEKYLLIMELMKCSTADLLRTQGPMAEDAVLDLMKDIAKALAYAEQQRLIHRDVKPDNILVNNEGICKLADLGIATPIAANGQAQQERTFGSPHYVAPEQARGGAIDSRADLYALGASAFHLLTGRTLFSGTGRQIIAGHINSPVPDIEELAPKVSDAIAELVYDLLEKDPADRPTNAQAVVTRIDDIRQHAKTLPGRSRPVRRRRRGRRR